MQRTMIIYESEGGVTKKIVQKMALILGPSRYCTTEEFKEDYKDYDFFVIATPIKKEKVNEKVSKFLVKNVAWLINKKVGIMGTGVDDDEGIRALKKLQAILGTSMVHCKCIKCDKCVEKIVQFSLELKRIRESFLRTMPKEDLKKCIEDFLNAHNTCDLSTGHNDWIRSTPIEYIYKDEQIYILSEGGKKFANILLNNRVSISIYNEFKGMNVLEGMQIRGKAYIVDEHSEEYERIISFKGVSKDKLTTLPGTLNCIRIEFDKVEFLCSKIKSLGYDLKQIYYYKSF